MEGLEALAELLRLARSTVERQVYARLYADAYAYYRRVTPEYRRLREAVLRRQCRWESLGPGRVRVDCPWGCYLVLYHRGPPQGLLVLRGCQPP